MSKLEGKLIESFGVKMNTIGDSWIPYADNVATCNKVLSKLPSGIIAFNGTDTYVNALAVVLSRSAKEDVQIANVASALEINTILTSTDAKVFIIVADKTEDAEDKVFYECARNIAFASSKLVLYSKPGEVTKMVYALSLEGVVISNDEFTQVSEVGHPEDVFIENLESYLVDAAALTTESASTTSPTELEEMQAKFNAALADKDTLISQYEDQIKGFGEAVKELEEKLNNSNKLNEQTKEQNNIYLAEIDELNATVGELRQKLEASHEGVAMEVAEKDKAVQELQEIVTSKDTEIVRLSSELENMRAELQNAQAMQVPVEITSQVEVAQEVASTEVVVPTLTIEETDFDETRGEVSPTETPVAMETTAVEEQAVTMAVPITEQTPVEEEAPVEGQTPVEETTAEESTTVAEEATTEEQTPVEETTAEETPVAEPAPTEVCLTPEQILSVEDGISLAYIRAYPDNYLIATDPNQPDYEFYWVANDPERHYYQYQISAQELHLIKPMQ